MFTNIASALIANTGLHVFTYTFLLSSQQIAIIVGVQFLVSILSQPIWSKASEIMDKKPAMILGIGSAVSFIATFFSLQSFTLNKLKVEAIQKQISEANRFN